MTTLLKRNNILGKKLIAIPTSFVIEDANPNTTHWFHLDIRPIWTSWSDEKVHYEVVIIYRNDKDKLVKFLENIEEKLNELIRKIVSKLTQ